MEVPRCIQTFRVVNSRGKPISGATVTLITGTEEVGSVRVKEDGLWRIRLIPGKEYSIEAEKSGSSSKKTFTACTSEIILTL